MLLVQKQLLPRSGDFWGAAYSTLSHEEPASSKSKQSRHVIIVGLDARNGLLKNFAAIIGLVVKKRGSQNRA